MRVYLTWRAYPPDPPYWEWIEDLPGIVVAISGMTSDMFDSLSFRHIKRKLGTRFTVIVDSLVTPLWKFKGIDLLRPQAFLLYIQRIIGADILVHKDYPLIDSNLSREEREKLWRRNIINAELALKLADRMGVEIMLVVQGWDLESYVRCAEIYRSLGAKYVGIGSLAPKKTNPDFVLKIAKAVKEVVGNTTRVHIFGVSVPRYISLLSSYADSVDISTPMRAAVAREILIVDKGVLRRYKFSLIDVENLEEELDERGRTLLNKVLSSSNVHELVWNLALLNAYIFFRWLREQSII